MVRPEAHEDLPVKVRPKEGPSRLCSSPPAFRETWALTRGVELPQLPGAGSIGECNPLVRSIKRSLPRRKSVPRKGANRELSLASVGEGHGRCEELGDAAPKNPVAYGAWNGGTAIVGTGEARLRPSSETFGMPTQGWTGRVGPYKRGGPVKWARGERESEWPIVPETAREQKLVQGRGHTWSMCRMEVRVGECPQG